MRGYSSRGNKNNDRSSLYVPAGVRKIISSEWFELLHIYNDWEGNELGEDCYSMVVVCRKKK